MEVTPSGMVTFVREEQDKNAFSQMLTKLFGKLIPVRFWQLEKAPYAMHAVPLFTV